MRFLSNYGETAIKTSTRKLNVGTSFRDFVTENVIKLGIKIIKTKPKHLEIVATLPFHHRDPFDRLIIAQCLTEDLPILTDDGFADTYAVKRIW